MGWANGRLFAHLSAKFPERRLLRTGLFVRLKDGTIKDFFEKRLMFPYWRAGKVTYFIGRRTDRRPDVPHESPKYKKLPTHSDRRPYVSPHVANDTFYNEDAVRGAKLLLVTEGVTDCISAFQSGVRCISPVTTTFRRADQSRLLDLTQPIPKIVLCNDCETNGSGEKGALETARVLHQAGRDVRIATIPLPSGRDKIDVNDLVKNGGPDALHAVLAEARPLLDHLIGRIPPETPKDELSAMLAPVLSLAAAMDPVRKEALSDLLQKRFKLKPATIKNQLRVARECMPEDTRRGAVYETDGHYCVLGRGGEHVAVSSFWIEPRQCISLPDGDIIAADVVTDRGTTYSNIHFTRDSWHCKRNFLKALKPLDLQWTGSDENVQGVLRLVAERDVPKRKGTLNLGYVETKAGSLWATPDGLLTPVGVPAPTEGIVYVHSGSSLCDRVSYQSCPPRTGRRAASEILPRLLELNSQEVMLPIIGWFFAAPLRPRVMKHLCQFPTLFIWGTQGSGKSSLVMEVFWPLLGVVTSEPYSATETEFALLKLLSSTDSLPVFIDEYKPHDMPPHRRNFLHRCIRRLYKGEVEERGRPDQTVTTYKLSAPLCVAGETRPTEAALVERILTSNPDKNRLSGGSVHTEAFEHVRSLDPSILARSLIRFLLGRDTDRDLDQATKQADDLLAGREVPIRIRENVTVMLLGLRHYTAFARYIRVEHAPLQVESAVNCLLDDLLEGGGASVKSGLDYFIEELSTMVVNGEISSGRQYTFKNGLLAIHFAACYSKYLEHCQRTGYSGEIQDRKALRRQLLENKRRGGYVEDIDHLRYLGGTRRRTVLIDLAEAKKTIDVDGFSPPEGAEHGC